MVHSNDFIAFKMRLCGSKQRTLLRNPGPKSRPGFTRVLFSPNLQKSYLEVILFDYKLMVVMSDLSPTTRRSSELGYAPHISRRSIFWIPARSMCDERLLLHLDLDEGCFDHPVLVLRTNTKQATATVLIVRLDISPSLTNSQEKKKKNSSFGETRVSIIY